MYRRLNPSDAKWFTRLVLKTYEPLIFESQFILKLCHPLLPAILKIREDFSAAISLLQSYRTRGLPSNDENSLSRCNLLAKVKPRLGVKVGRQNWFKARSIKHCFDLGSGRMSVEQKVDGEYCQVHIDLSKASRRIQVFSKSGKDSTEDRCDIHG
jgi:DNA ligase-4